MFDILNDVPIDALKVGYQFCHSTNAYECLFCGQQYTKGMIYHDGEDLVDATYAMERHIIDAHTSPFHALLTLDKKQVGLTDVQKEILSQFYEGIPDNTIAKEAGISASTVRYQRYKFREKAKQAKLLYTISELLAEQNDLPKIHRGATMVDERYMITQEETEKVMKTYFSSLEPLKLKSFPVKEKRKLIILREMIKQFEEDTQYTEKQVNEIIKEIYDDYVTIRRYFIEYGFMDRKRDGSAYWLK